MRVGSHVWSPTSCTSKASIGQIWTNAIFMGHWVLTECFQNLPRDFQNVFGSSTVPSVTFSPPIHTPFAANSSLLFTTDMLLQISISPTIAAGWSSIGPVVKQWPNHLHIRIIDAYDQNAALIPPNRILYIHRPELSTLVPNPTNAPPSTPIPLHKETTSPSPLPKPLLLVRPCIPRISAEKLIEAQDTWS